MRGSHPLQNNPSPKRVLIPLSRTLSPRSLTSALFILHWGLVSLDRNGQQGLLFVAGHCPREWTDLGGGRRWVKSANSLTHIKAQQTSPSKAHPSGFQKRNSRRLWSRYRSVCLATTPNKTTEKQQQTPQHPRHLWPTLGSATRFMCSSYIFRILG